MPLERDQAVRLIESLVSLLRAGRTVTHRAAERSVSATPIALLRHVRDTDPRLGDLAGQLMVKPSVASRAVAALESHGYVTRVADPTDARACRIHLTESGRAHLKDREEQTLQLLGARFGDWSPAEVEQSIRVLQRLELTIADWLTAGEPATGSTGPQPQPAAPAAGTVHSTTWEKSTV